MGSQRILICDKLDPEGNRLLEEAGFQVDVPGKLGEAELVKKIPDYDAVVVRSATRISTKVITAGKNLKLIGRAGVGVDNIDVAEATRRGILVMNAPDANAVTTAELALSHLMALSRKLIPADRSVRAGKWEKSRFLGQEVTGKTLGIVGLGRIGRAVAERAVGLKMRVLAFDPFLIGEESPIPSVHLVEFPQLLAESDFITIHAPLNDKTRNLFSAAAFAEMKKGAMLINCARGEIVNEKDLAHALQEGLLGGAALDVFAEEPPGDSPLFALENISFTPHVGASTGEAQRNVALDMAAQIRDFFTRGVARNTVNAPAISEEVSAMLRPFVALGEKIGSFIAQTQDSPVSEIEITYRGNIHDLDLSPVRVATLAGLIQPTMDTPVNQVNAPLIAGERNLKVSEIREAKAVDYLNLIAVKATTRDGKGCRVAGTVFGRHPRFVAVDGFTLDALPDGDLLVTRHLDRPGIIGKIGSVMGNAKVNIARLQLGISEDEGDIAIALLNIDSTPSAEVLEKIRNIPDIREARYVRL